MIKMRTQLAGLKHDPLDCPASAMVAEPALQGIHVGRGDSLPNQRPLGVNDAYMS